MEGIFLGKIDQTAFEPRSISLSFRTKHLDQHVEVRKELDYDCDYVLVKADDVITTNDELLRLREEVKEWDDECKEWKKRYSTVNNELFQKGLAYGTLETAYKNEKIAGEMLIKDRDALKEKVEKLEAELTEIKTARTLREAYITGVEKGCESLREERDRWKRRFTSVVNDLSKSLEANGIEFKLKGIDGDAEWVFIIDIPELNEAKKKVEDLEKKLAASKSNEAYWRDRKEEEEDYHHYWHYTFDRAVKQAAEKGVYIAIAGKDDDCNAGIVVVENKKTTDLESQVVQMEDANQKLRKRISAVDEELEAATKRGDYWKSKYDDLAEYWDNTYKDIVACGAKVGVKIEFKGDKSDSNAGFVYVTNEMALDQAYNLNRTRQMHDKKWQAMTEALKAKGVEVIYMGEEGGKPVIDVKIPKLDELQKDFEDLNAKYINRGSKIECLELDLRDSKNKDNKYEKLFIEATNMKDYWYSTYYEAVRQSWSQGVSIRIDRANLKDNVGIVQVNNERAEELKKEIEDLKSKKVATATLEACDDGGLKFIYTYMDGHNEAASFADLCKNYVAFDAESLSHGTVPKCSSCAHYMYKGDPFAHRWCYKAVHKDGPKFIRRLSTEEAEGPACSDFKARKE